MSQAHTDTAWFSMPGNSITGARLRKTESQTP